MENEEFASGEPSTSGHVAAGTLTARLLCRSCVHEASPVTQSAEFSFDLHTTF